MNIEIKYAKMTLNSIAALLWFLAACISTYSFIRLVMIYDTLLMSPTLLFVPFQIYCAIYLLRLNKRTYVAINDFTLLLDRGNFMKKKEFDLSQVSMIKRVGNDIRIKMMSGKESRIRLNAMTTESIDRILVALESLKMKYDYTIDV
jgi:hypothetical protein